MDWKEVFERSRVIYFSIFLFALILRVWNFDADPFGDEAWHLFLTRTLGFGKYLESVPSHPPLLYFLYFPFSGSLLTFRIINVVVGSLIPTIIYAILLNYRIKKFYALGGAFLASVHPLLVQFSSFVFYEVLATFFSLLALLCMQKAMDRLSVVFISLATLTKEYYALLGLGLFITSVMEEKKLLSKRSMRFILPLVPVSIWYYFMLGPTSFPSMSITHIGLEEWSLVFLSIWLLPLYFLLLWLKKYREFLLLFIYPTFLLVWHYGFAIGVDNWYLVLPSALAIPFFCLIIDKLESTIRSKWNTNHPLSKVTLLLPSILLLASCMIIPPTYSFIRDFHGRSLITTTEYVKVNYPNQRLLTIDVYWGYAYYPLSEVASEVKKEYTHVRPDNLQYYVDCIYSYDLTIVYKTSDPLNIRLRSYFSNNIVYETSHYTLIKLTNNFEV